MCVFNDGLNDGLNGLELWEWAGSKFRRRSWRPSCARWRPKCSTARSTCWRRGGASARRPSDPPPPLRCGPQPTGSCLIGHPCGRDLILSDPARLDPMRSDRILPVRIRPARSDPSCRCGPRLAPVGALSGDGDLKRESDRKRSEATGSGRRRPESTGSDRERPGGTGSDRERATTSCHGI